MRMQMVGMRIWRKAERSGRVGVLLSSNVCQRYIASLVHFSEALGELRHPA